VAERSTGSGTTATGQAPAITAPPTPAEKLASAQRAEARGDFAGAVATLKALAEAGEASAQTKLGDMYATGRGVARDDAVAAVWYRKAADQGDTAGQISLGHLYEDGRGIRKNYNQAYIWYSLAMRSGSTTAAADRVRISSRLQPAEIKQADRVVDSMLAR
jgi:TPR repeat protein